MIKLRRWLAEMLVRLARKIDAQHPAVYAFWADRFMEQAITGNSFIKVTVIPPEEIVFDAAVDSSSSNRRSGRHKGEAVKLGDLGDYADRLEAHVGERADIVINYKCPTLRAIAATLRLAEKEIARCHERLEIDHHYMDCGDGKGLTRVNVPIDERGKYPDAVSCRDETIKILQRTRPPSPRGGGGSSN